MLFLSSNGTGAFFCPVALNKIKGQLEPNSPMIERYAITFFFDSRYAITLKMHCLSYSLSFMFREFAVVCSDSVLRLIGFAGEFCFCSSTPVSQCSS